MGYRDIFRLIPANEMAAIADVFSRNEILTPNEVRQIIGRKPDMNPKSNELSNRNMPTEKRKAFDPYLDRANDNKPKQEELEDVEK